MKKFFIISIIVVLAVTFALVIKEKGLLDKWLKNNTETSSEEPKEEVKKEIPIEIVDMDGFVFTIVKSAKVLASMEVSFKILVAADIKEDMTLNRSLLRARINSIVYDYIEKYYTGKIDLEKMKAFILNQLKHFYGKDKVADVLYAFYYIRPAL